MIVLRFSMQGEYIIERTIGKTCRVFTFYYARGRHLEHTETKCHLCAFKVNLYIIVQHTHTHTHPL